MVVHASFEDFLYIIIGLAWVIYSAYSAKKKQKAKNNPAQAKKSKSFLESLMSEIGMPEEKKQPIANNSSHDVNYHDDNIEDEEPSTVFSYDDEYEESNFKPSFNDIDTKPVRTFEKVAAGVDKQFDAPGKNADSIKKKNIKKRIDLRKAVIYSVILKKVYF